VKNNFLSPHKRLLIKIIPHHTESVYKLEISHLHLAIGAACMLLLSLALMMSHVGAVRAAEAKVMTLQRVDAQQRRQLADMSRQTQSMWKRLKLLQQNEKEIRSLSGIGEKKTPVHPSAPKPASAAAASAPAPSSSHVRPVAVVRSPSAQPIWDAIAAWLTQGREGGPVTFASESEQLVQLNAQLNQVWIDEALLRADAQAAADARVAASLAHQRYLDGIPSLWPTAGYVSSGFGYRTYPDVGFHPGLDIVNDYGSPVFATASGTVQEAGWDGGYGYKIAIDHGNGFVTWYGHNSRLLVSAGQTVRKGQEIAEIGSTGFATGPHVHYEILQWGTPIDPTPYL
jgi:murein DD-endopeptidase MepM/ murein hydrolase activator NlpD